MQSRTNAKLERHSIAHQHMVSIYILNTPFKNLCIKSLSALGLFQTYSSNKSSLICVSTSSFLMIFK